jgi:outer membrane protein OmpA-like peptidoglycan-associated protein
VNFRFDASRQGDRTVLAGYVPDELSKTRLGQFLGVDASGLQVARGEPEHFQSAADLLIESMAHLSEGSGSLEGTTLSLTGRAASEADYVALEAAIGLGAPQGMTLGDIDIRPPLASPFTLSVEKSADGAYALSGYTPSHDTERALTNAVSGPATESLSLADGAPPDFEASAIKGLHVLDALSSGTLSFDGTSWSISGRADSPEIAAAAAKAYADAGLDSAAWSYEVAVPPAVAVVPDVSPYGFSAVKGTDGKVTLSGYVPDADLQRTFALRARGPLADGTALGNGAPKDFATAAMAGFDALAAFDQGTLSLNGGHWSIEGDVASTARRLALEAVLGRLTDTSDWHVAIQAADAAPVVSPFRWAAEKDADGRIQLSGYVPTEDLRSLLAVRAGLVVGDSSLVGSGEPVGFSEAALSGLDALAHLRSGRVAYDGGRWSLDGQPASEDDATAALAAVADVPGGDGGWVTSLAAPPPPTASAAAEALPAGAVAPAEVPVAAAAIPTSETPPTEAVESPVADATPAGDAAAAETVASETPAVAASPVETPAAATSATVDQPPAEPATVVAEAEPVAAPEPASAAPDFIFEASKPLGGRLSFSGAVPAEPVRQDLAEIAGAKPSADLSVGEGLPDDFAVNADAGARALVALADGQYGLDGTTWVLTGRAVSDVQRQAALSSLDGVSGRWRTDITLVPPLAYCRAEIATFTTRNAILFQSGSARITPDSGAALDELAAYLAQCPKTLVDVEGHTDADGDADANLSLSVDRALAVVDALIARGIGEERLYAVGYGESLPVASNDTAAGKRANRRIAFGLHDDGE